MFDATFSIIEDEDQRNELQIFYADNYRRFIHIAMQKVKSNDNAEDVIQEVFSDIADKPEIFFNVPQGERVTYVDVLVRNTAISTFKKERNRTDRLEELDEEIADESVQIEDEALAKVTREELVNYILTLPERQKAVIELRVIMKISVSEIAERLGVSVETVNWHLKTARKNIRNFIEKGKLL